MVGPPRSAVEIVEELLTKAISNGECLECHLRPSIDERGRERHYVQIGGRCGSKRGVPRLVYQIKKGEIPKYMVVMHTCDNTKCLNPMHLTIGTSADNTADMMAKGRWKSDPTVGSRRREYTANRIRPLYEQGLSIHEIANKLRISASTVWNYTNGPYSESLSSGDSNAVGMGLD